MSLFLFEHSTPGCKDHVVTTFLQHPLPLTLVLRPATFLLLVVPAIVFGCVGADFGFKVVSCDKILRRWLRSRTRRSNGSLRGWARQGRLV